MIVIVNQSFITKFTLLAFNSFPESKNWSFQFILLDFMRASSSWSEFFRFAFLKCLRFGEIWIDHQIINWSLIMNWSERRIYLMCPLKAIKATLSMGQVWILTLCNCQDHFHNQYCIWIFPRRAIPSAVSSPVHYLSFQLANMIEADSTQAQFQGWISLRAFSCKNSWKYEINGRFYYMSVKHFRLCKFGLFDSSCWRMTEQKNYLTVNDTRNRSHRREVIEKRNKTKSTEIVMQN